MASPLNDTRRTVEPELSPNRKLIRPSLAEVRDQLARAGNGPASAAHASPAMPTLPARPPKKPVPPDQTNAESFYFLKQMQTKTEMVVVLRDGEKLRGVIEWYDRHCIKVHRNGEPNLLIYKAIIKYIYKAEDEARASQS